MKGKCPCPVFNGTAYFVLQTKGPCPVFNGTAYFVLQTKGPCMKNMKNIRKKIEISDSVIIMLDTSKDTVMRVRIGTGMDGIAAS